jgi:hypothetical protein
MFERENYNLNLLEKYEINDDGKPMVYNWIRGVIHYADRLNPQQWLLVLGVVIIIGLVCLRGFGSRSQY